MDKLLVISKDEVDLESKFHLNTTDHVGRKHVHFGGSHAGLRHCQ